MEAFLRYPELALAAKATAPQIETWITRGLFVPANATAPGRFRRFTAEDAYCAAIMAYAVHHCRLPVIVAAHLSAFARGLSQELLWAEGDSPNNPADLFAVVFPEAAEKMTAMLDQTVVDTMTFANGWEGPGASVLWTLKQRDPTGVTVINMSRIAREARQRMMDALCAGLSLPDEGAE